MIKMFTAQISLAEMEAEIKREIVMRQRVYPRFVETGKLTETDANLQLLKMQAVLVLIQSEIKRTNPQGDLF